MNVQELSIRDVKAPITAIVDKYAGRPTALVMMLQDIQDRYRYLPETALKVLSDQTRLPLAQIYGVATFFKAFSLTPKGKHHVCVCTGTACHVRQATIIVEKFERDLGIKPGQTSPDRQFSLETVNCLGACALGPLVTIDGEYHGNMNVTKVDKALGEVRQLDEQPVATKETV